MATVQDVKEAAKRLQNALDTATSTSPCKDSTSCVQIVNEFGADLERNVALFVGSTPDPSLCAPVVAALDAMAAAAAAAPPVDDASAWAFENRWADAMGAMEGGPKPNKTMSTIQGVEQAVQNLFGAVEAVTAEAPCSQSLSCIVSAQAAASQVNLALLPYVASKPDDASCARAVTALDTLAATIRQSPPLDEASTAAIQKDVDSTLAAMRPPSRG